MIELFNDLLTIRAFIYFFVVTMLSLILFMIVATNFRICDKLTKLRHYDINNRKIYTTFFKFMYYQSVFNIVLFPSIYTEILY